MTWLRSFNLRAFVVIIQVALIYSDENGPLPGFKQQSADTIVQSANQTILCEVKGERPLKISWLKDESILDLKKQTYLTISSEGSLNIYNTNRKRDEGSYRCVVENRYGRVISRSAKLTFPYMNQFSVLDSRVTVNEGEKAYLACHAPQSYPDRNIYWSKLKTTGNFPLQLEKNSHFTTSKEGNLYFSYTDNSDFGVYYCSVENNNLRRVLKRTVVLEIKPTRQKNIPPSVWVFQDRIAMKDSNFVLECISYGRPIPVMRFRHSKTGATLTGSKQIGNRLRHDFGKFEAQHEGEYSCELSNTFAQTASRTAYIKMEAKPVLVKKSHAISVAVDSIITLPCRASAIPSASYTWFFNGYLLAANREATYNQGNLTIPKVMRHHEGFYQCVSYNKHGEDIMTVHFKVVEKKPSFDHNSVKPAISTHSIVGGSAEINCIPNGAPKPTILWRKKNSSIDIISQDDRFTVLPTGTLKITKIQRSDQGLYECIAENRLGKLIVEGNLMVAGGLAITQPLTYNDQIIIGQKMILKCITSTSEIMETVFRWYIGGVHSKRKLRSRGRTKITNVNSKQSILEINNVNSRDTGIYSCEAKGTKNRSDQRSQLVIVTGPNGHEVPDISKRPPGFKTTAVPSKETTELNLIGPPEPPLDVTASELSGINIKISWTMSLDNGSPPTRVYIQARTTFDIDNWETVKISNKTKKFRESEIVPLSPWVEYKIRVIAENKFGLSKPSIETDKWVRTPTAKPSRYPDNIRGEGTGPNQLTIIFDALDEIDQNAPGIEYVIHHREKHGSYDMVTNNVPGGQNKLILDFQSSDSYYKEFQFQVQAKNSIGFGPKSPIYSAFTGERTPLGVPRNLNVQITSASSAVASWDGISTSREVMRGKLIGYKLLYWVKPKNGYPRVEQYVTSHSTKVVINLFPYTEYYFQVLSFNRAGDGPGGNVVGPMETPEGKPSAPVNLRVSEASEGQATLTWSHPKHKNGLLIQYVLTYQQLPSGHVNEKELSPDVTYHVISDLSPISKYIIKLAAVTMEEIGEHAEIIFDFSKIPLIAPETPRIGSIGYNAVVLSWSPVKADDISGYKILYWESGKTTKKVIALWERSDDIVTTVLNLKSDTIYFFQVAVVNQYGTGPRSEAVQARTKYNKNVIPAKTADTEKKSSSNIKLTVMDTIMLVSVLIAIFVPR